MEVHKTLFAGQKSPAFNSKSHSFFTAGLLRSLFLSVALLTLLAHTAEAATAYYVRKDGKDSNDGKSDSASGAWLTIQKAANTVAAGDTVNIAAGTYAESVTFSTNGTSSARILWTGTGTVNVNHLWVSSSYNTFSNFTLLGTGLKNTGMIEMPGTQTANYFYYITHNGTANTLTDSEGIIRAIYSPTNCIFDHFTINEFNDQGVLLSGSGHKISFWKASSVNGWDMFRPQGSNITISDCDLYLTNHVANGNHTDFFQVYNNDGATVSQNVIVERCIIKSDSTADIQIGNFSDDQKNGAISKWTFRNNWIINVANACNQGAPGFTWQNNTFVNVSTTSGWCIYVSAKQYAGAPDTIIKNNIFYNCGFNTTNSGWYNSDEIIGLQADYNLVVGTGAGQTKDSTMWSKGAYGGGSYEAHGFNGIAPPFVDAAGGDYRPYRDGTAAINGIGATFSPANAKATFVN